ncbi:MAG: hypothetical protein RL112_2320, partial [Planctomycetota bacterium]
MNARPRSRLARRALLVVALAALATAWFRRDRWLEA